MKKEWNKLWNDNWRKKETLKWNLRGGIAWLLQGFDRKKVFSSHLPKCFLHFKSILFKSQILTVIKELNSLSLYVLHDNLRKGSAYDFFLVKLINHSGGSLLYYDVFFFI